MNLFNSAIQRKTRRYRIICSDQLGYLWIILRVMIGNTDTHITAYKCPLAKVSYGFRAALWDGRSSALTRRINAR